MSADSKVSTQTVAPVHPSSANRKPSDKEKSWEEKTLRPTLAKSPERQAEFTTVSGYPIQRLYNPADLSWWGAERDLRYPGDTPYSHSIHSTMPSGRRWTVLPYCSYCDS